MNRAQRSLQLSVAVLLTLVVADIAPAQANKDAQAKLNNVYDTQWKDFKFGHMEKCQTCSVTQFCSPCIGLNQQEQRVIDVPSDETCRIATLTAETFREKKRLKVLPNTRSESLDVSHCAMG